MSRRTALSLVLIAAVVARACHGAAVPAEAHAHRISSAAHISSSSGSASRQLLQNQNVVWPRESAAITSARDVINRLIVNGNGPAEGIKSGARALEIARLASNKAVQPWEFDRVAPPPQPGSRPARQVNALGRRLMTT